LANVQCRAGAENFTMHVHDASFGGLFLKGCTDEHLAVPPEEELELVLTPTEGQRAPIALRGKVVRMVDVGLQLGFGIMVTGMDPLNAERYHDFLRRRA